LAVGLALGLMAGCDDGGGDSTPTADMATGGAGGMGGAGGGGDAGPDAQAGVGLLVVEPAELAFGQVAVGEGAEADLVLRNDGDGDLQVTAFEGLAAPFGASRMPPISVPAGASRTVVFTVQPEAAGALAQTVRLITDVPDAAPVEVPLSAQAVQPTGEPEADTLDFGTVEPGTPGGDFIRIQNTSEIATLRINAVVGVAAPFEVPDGQLPAEAPPGQSAQVLIQFNPDAEGEFMQAVTVSTNAGSFEITLQGRAITAGELSVQAVQPAWAPLDVEQRVVVFGGPFEAAPTAIMVGAVALQDLELLDAHRVAGNVPAGAQAPGGLVDVRVEIGGSFGVGPALFVRTPPVGQGQALDAAALAAGTVGPEGNPWTLAVDQIPAESELEIQPGTVILADAGAALAVDGTLRTPEGGVVVFAPAAPDAPWAGLRFADATPASSLNGLVVQGAGAEGAPCVTTAGTASFNRVQVHGCGGDGLRVAAGGTLVVLGGTFADVAGDAMALPTADSTVFRLQGTWVYGARWPVRALLQHFGGRPIGSGHLWWGNATDAIGVGGTVDGALTLSGQPEGVTYRVADPVAVAAGGTLSLALNAPFRLDAELAVAGTLSLPAGGGINADGGRIVIAEGGTLTARGTQADRVVLQARPDPEVPNPGGWGGVVIEPGGVLDVENATFRDGGLGGEGANLVINADFEPVRGCAFDDSARTGVVINGSGFLLNSTWLGNGAESVRVTGGSGRLTGVTADAANPALVFDPVELCADWEVPAFRLPDMSDAASNCPAE
ncbi:MAG: choice-of-anchor D domain-containing protein, partial [Myxococcales bacterium]|nr:choice-of-anchor D domain-containing protein [Myxococcales bacterium]